MAHAASYYLGGVLEILSGYGISYKITAEYVLYSASSERTVEQPGNLLISSLDFITNVQKIPRDNYLINYFTLTQIAGGISGFTVLLPKLYLKC